MDLEWRWVNAVVPKMSQKLLRRYSLLLTVRQMQPVGRRSLAEKMNLTERTVRTDLDSLVDTGLVSMQTNGAWLTDDGQKAILNLQPLVADLTGLRKKETLLKERLSLQDCLIVSGDSDERPDVKQAMGKAANDLLRQQLPVGESIVAVMGGTTMAAVAETLSATLAENRQLTFVPARGGMGESPNIQANTICARMAEATKGHFQALYLPELSSESTSTSLRHEPAIAKTLELIDRANVAIHCVGDAMAMAKRRQMSDKVTATLVKRHAVGEAFGDFFDQDGQIVYRVPKLGLSISDLERMDLVVAVAGGHSKAAAVEAYFKIPPAKTFLITDEGLADMILK
ncbi:central glycolytic genes regulator [Secundilactobacillus silagincola]|uniref:Central glycolytic genes regulator n=1 Tax=Secundilactobacillus silagincola TaxID=1714681 RepID=A0A1Z5J4E8_9LACO|nr:sugar-binding domain-containing protein [Secundilactobacillus silagincola]GAX08682.1 central glycolytic genes regulator [Secundilactobacillus silagincola]